MIYHFTLNTEYLFMCFFCSLLLKEVPSNCLSFMPHKTWIFPGIQAPRCEGLENTNQSKGGLPVSRFRDLCYFPFVSHVVQRSCGVREWVREGKWGRWMDGWRGEGRKDGNRERQTTTEGNTALYSAVSPRCIKVLPFHQH